MARRKHRDWRGPPRQTPISDEELGMMVIALYAMDATDHREEYEDFRSRMSGLLRKRRPDVHHRLVEAGDAQ